MPRYFFHVCDGGSYEDLQGTELPNLEAARKEAVRFSGALLIDHSTEFWNTGQWQMRVTDDANLTLFQLTFYATDAPAAGGFSG